MAEQAEPEPPSSSSITDRSVGSGSSVFGYHRTVRMGSILTGSGMLAGIAAFAWTNRDSQSYIWIMVAGAVLLSVGVLLLLARVIFSPREEPYERLERLIKLVRGSR